MDIANGNSFGVMQGGAFGVSPAMLPPALNTEPMIFKMMLPIRPYSCE